MSFKDLRSFLGAIEEKGEAAKVTAEVNWDEEIGAIFQESVFRQSPAPIFTNITGYKNTHGKTLAMAMDSSLRRVCIALGLKENSTRSELVRFWRERSRKQQKPILVSTGPCKEVIHKGAEVNLLEFPVPKLHPLDGGRYILTWHIIVTKDPETGWVNAGTYRGMLLDKNSIGVLMQWPAHWSMHAAKYKAMGKPMPVAACIGVDMVTMMVSTTPSPFGVSEYDIAGAINNEPMELVKAETVDLEVPSGAEIVLEGEISLDPATFRLEGPFGEYPGHYTGLGAEARPVFKVNCVTHRKDPIFTSSSPGMAPAVSPEFSGNQTEHSYMSFVGPALTWNHLEDAGVAGITGVSGYGPGATITVVSIKQQYYGHARQVANALWGASRGGSKYVIVVDSDIDASDLHKVMLSVANRCQGSKGITVFPDTHGAGLDPAVHPDLKKKLDGSSSWDRVFIDATWPFDWEPREEWGGLKHPPNCRSSASVLNRVRQRWQELNLNGPTKKH